MRKDDQDDRPHFRSSDRLFCTNGKWFFETREDDHGPFDTREAAEAELKQFIRKMVAQREAETPPVPEMTMPTGRFSDATSDDLQLVDKDESPPAAP